MIDAIFRKTSVTSKLRDVSLEKKEQVKKELAQALNDYPKLAKKIIHTFAQDPLKPIVQLIGDVVGPMTLSLHFDINVSPTILRESEKAGLGTEEWATKIIHEHLMAISKKFVCPAEGCDKSYATFKSLRGHALSKHGLSLREEDFIE